MIKFTRVKHRDCPVKPRKGEVFCSNIIKMEPPGLTFNKPVDVYLTHSAAEQDPSADYYDVTVQQLEQEWEDLETHHISKREGRICYILCPVGMYSYSIFDFAK